MASDRVTGVRGTAFDQILGVIQHDLYHAGQAVILLKFVRGPGTPA